MQRKDEFALGGKYVTKEDFNFNKDSLDELITLAIIKSEKDSHDAINNVYVSEEMTAYLEHKQETHNNLNALRTFMCEILDSHKMFRVYSLDEISSYLVPVFEMMLNSLDQYPKFEQYRSILINLRLNLVDLAIDMSKKNINEILEEKFDMIKTGNNAKDVIEESTNETEKMEDDFKKINNMFDKLQAFINKAQGEQKEKHKEVYEIFNDIKKIDQKIQEYMTIDNDDMLEERNEIIKEKQQKEKELIAKIGEIEYLAKRIDCAVKLTTELHKNQGTKLSESDKLLEDLAALKKLLPDPKEEKSEKFDNHESNQEGVEMTLPQQENNAQDIENSQQDPQLDVSGKTNEMSGDEMSGD